MKLDRARLQEVLSILGTSVGNKVMEVCDYVTFRVDKQATKLYMFTTNMYAFLSVDFGDVSLAEIDNVPDIFLIDYKMLNAVVKNSTTEIVEFIDKDTTVEIVSNGRYKFRKFANLDDLPSADLSHDSLMAWPVPMLSGIWNKARVAVSNDVTKINYQGVYYDGNFVATDNRRISIVHGPEYDGPAMLISPIFGDVLKHCRNEVKIGKGTNSDLVVMVCEEVGLMAGVRLIDAKFVNYKPILESLQPDYRIVVEKRLVLGALSRLLPFTDKMFKVLNVKASKEGDVCRLTLSVDHDDAGTEVLSAKESSGKSDNWTLEKKYHIDNFYDGIAVTDSPDVVTLNFNDAGKFWMSEDGFEYLQTMIT